MKFIKQEAKFEVVVKQLNAGGDNYVEHEWTFDTKSAATEYINELPASSQLVRFRKVREYVLAPQTEVW